MGQHDYRLESLADDELLAGLSSIVGRRNQITAEFLAYLAELDERQLFLDLGFASLFEYCVEALKLCESTAGRHIAAARVCRKHPEVFARVASGALHASGLSLLRKNLTPDNAAELFALCEHRSTRKIEELLATRFPRPDVRDLVRRLPAQARPTLDAERGSEQRPTEPPCEMTAIRQQPFVESHPNGFRPPDSRQHEPSALNAAEAAAEAAEATHAANAANATKQRRLEPLSADRYGVHFTADGEFRELLERVRGLAGHRLPSGDLMTLLKRGLEAYERELEKERFAVGSKPRSGRSVAPAPAPPKAALSGPDLPELALSASDPSNLALQSMPVSIPNPEPKRRCPAAVARAVFLRDGRQCSYVAPDGRRCSTPSGITKRVARRCLELDHVKPRAMGGENTIENLRLRCRVHNQRYARQYYGKARVEAAVQHARRKRAAQGQPGNRCHAFRLPPDMG